MRFHLVFVGKTAAGGLEEAVRGYLKRLRHYAPCEVHIVKAEKISAKTSPDSVRQRESERILKRVGGQGHLIVWDQRGRQMNSVAFAAYVERLGIEGISNVWMIVGGPLGVSQELRQAAHSVLSLSEMTFPHDVARLLAVEQLYRAFTIMRGEPYHK